MGFVWWNGQVGWDELQSGLLTTQLPPGWTPTPGAKLQVKTHKKVKKRRKIPHTNLKKIKHGLPRKQKPNYLYAAASKLHNFIVINGAAGGYIPSIQEILRELNAGYFNPLYWEKCPVEAVDYFGCNPTWIPHPTPPPYSFPDPTNLPSIPTYGATFPDIAPARYSGISSGGYYHDDLLVWSRSIFKLNRPIEQDLEEFAILHLNGNITIAADQRGSRPMFSLMVQEWLADIASPSMTGEEPPINKTRPPKLANLFGAQSLYWRYKLPLTNPPYFATVQTRRMTYMAHARATLDTGGQFTHYVCTLAPRPMLGRGYNNNVNVDTSIDFLPDLYQIRLPVAGFLYGGKIIKADGTFVDNPGIGPTIGLPFQAYIDGQHYLFTANDPDTGGIALYVRNGPGTPQKLAPWWNYNPAGNMADPIVQAYPAFGGYMVATYEDPNPYVDVWYINAAGATTGQTNTQLTPSLTVLVDNGPDPRGYMPELDLYAYSDTIYSGVRRVKLYNALGVLQQTIDNESTLCPTNVPLISFGNKLFAVWLVNNDPTFTVELWRMDTVPASLIVAFDIPGSPYIGQTAHNGLIYIFPYDYTATAYTIDEFGTVSNIENPDIPYLWGAQEQICRWFDL